MGHKLSEISISNYKSILFETFELSDYTPLVGYNNAGKSNILSAIKWLLRKSSLGPECFNQLTSPIIVEGKIEGITAALLQSLEQGHRASITPYVVNDELRIKRVQNQPGDTATNIKIHIWNPAAATPASQWVSNPTGIENAILSLFPEPIQIGAMENAEEDVSKSKSGTTIGKLLAEIIGPIEAQYGQNVQAALQGLKDLLDAEGQQRAPELNQFDAAVNQKIDNFFPGVTIKLHVPSPELKEVFTKGTIKVYEPHSAAGRDVSAMGHGSQRSIQMALIRHLADIKRTTQGNTTTTLLLIDEPELYLHPQAIENVREALKKLSSQGYQVIFSTHSPMMITQDDVANTILIRKNAVQGTHVRRTLKAAIPQIIQHAPTQLELLFSLSNSANILFAEKIILTEGQTEHKVLPKVFERILGNGLGSHKFALVKQGGVANTKKSMQVLGVMDLPAKAIVDLDYAFKNAVGDGFLQARDSDIQACHQIMAQLAAANGIALGSDGWPVNKMSNMSASDAFALLASQHNAQQHIQNLHTKLLAQGIWLWRKGAIEKHLGLTGKTEQAWANFCTQLAAGTPQGVIPDFAEVNGCMQWLLI